MRRAILPGLLLFGVCLVWLAWSDRRAMALGGNTLLLAAATSVIAVPLGTLLALLLARGSAVGRRFAILLLTVLLLMPLYLQSAAWTAGFGTQGWLALITETLDRPMLAGWRGAIWVHAMAAVPWVALIAAVGLWLAEPDIEEAALLDSALWQTTLYITLARAFPAIALALLWVVVMTAGEMTVTDIFQVRTYAEELYTGFALGDDLLRLNLRLLPLMLLLIVTVTVALVRVSRSIAPGATTVSSRSRTVQGRRWRMISGILLLALLLVIAGVPLANLIYKAGMDVEQIGATRVRTWSSAKFVRLLLPLAGDYQQSAMWRFRGEFGWSLLLGLIVATVSALSGLLSAWSGLRRPRLAVVFIVVAATLMSLPGPLLALGVIQLLNQEGIPLLIWLYDRTLFAPVLVLCLRTFPWAYLICWAGLQTLPREQLESAAAEGAGSLHMLWRVVLPQRIPAVLAAWLAVLAISTGDLTASILVMPPGVMTVPISIFNLIHAGVDDVVAAYCLTALVGYALLAGLILSCLRRVCPTAFLP